MLEDIEEATRRVLRTTEGLGGDELREKSLLPGWPRGHVLSHLSGQVHGLCRLLEWARTGIETPQYASMAAREREIEEDAHRTALELHAEVRDTATLFRETVRALPEDAWCEPIRPCTGEWCRADRVLHIRLRELEVHHVDLAAGYDFVHIPERTAERIVHDVLDVFGARADMPAVEIRAEDTGLRRMLGQSGPRVSGTLSELLSWVTGRSEGSGLVVRDAEKLPALPEWI